MGKFNILDFNTFAVYDYYWTYKMNFLFTKHLCLDVREILNAVTLTHDAQHYYVHISWDPEVNHS